MHIWIFFSKNKTNFYFNRNRIFNHIRSYVHNRNLNKQMLLTLQNAISFKVVFSPQNYCFYPNICRKIDMTCHFFAENWNLSNIPVSLILSITDGNISHSDGISLISRSCVSADAVHLVGWMQNVVKNKHTNVKLIKDMC
jgi:hypothetical protein